MAARNNAVPRTSLLVAKNLSRPVISDTFTYTAALKEFSDELFDALDRRAAPQGTGVLEASKLMAFIGLYAAYLPDDDTCFRCKWRTKALFKVCDAEYVKTRNGDALTKAGLAAYLAMEIILRPDWYYLVLSVLAVQLGVSKHFVRQQFPQSLAADVAAARSTNFANMFCIEYQKFYSAPPLSAPVGTNNNGAKAAAAELLVEAVKWYISN